MRLSVAKLETYFTRIENIINDIKGKVTAHEIATALMVQDAFLTYGESRAIVKEYVREIKRK